MVNFTIGIDKVSTYAKMNQLNKEGWSKMANCTICGKRVVLVPSAAERARRFGGKPSDYTKLFTEHAECVVKKRELETLELIRRL